MLRLPLALSLAVLTATGSALAQDAPIETDPPADPGAGVGEPCAARTDCAEGLRCFASTCRHDDGVLIPLRVTSELDEPRPMRSVPRVVTGSVLTGLGSIQITIGAILLGVAGAGHQPSTESTAPCTSFCLSSLSGLDGLGEKAAGIGLVGNGALMTLIGLPLLITGAIPEEPPSPSAVRVEPTSNGIRVVF